MAGEGRILTTHLARRACRATAALPGSAQRTPPRSLLLSNLHKPGAAPRLSRERRGAAAHAVPWRERRRAGGRRPSAAAGHPAGLALPGPPGRSGSLSGGRGQPRAAPAGLHDRVPLHARAQAARSIGRARPPPRRTGPRPGGWMLDSYILDITEQKRAGDGLRACRRRAAPRRRASCSARRRRRAWPKTGSP